MKVKMKALAVAVALSATSGMASALELGQFGAPGQVIFSIWDNTVGNEASFTFGLNFNTSTFDGNASYTFENLFSHEAFTANFDAENFAAMSNWRWNVVGGKAGNDDDHFQFTSIIDGVQINNDAAANGANAALEYARTLHNRFGVSDVYGTNGITDAAWAGNPLFGNNVNGLPINSAGRVGDELFFYNAHNQTLDFFFDPPHNDAEMTLFAGVWQLDADGTLTYGALGAPVPVPAAVWLLGSALIGLVGVARRREAQAEALTA